MKPRKILGGILLSLPFVAVTAFAANRIGFLFAVTVVLICLGLIGCIFGGSYLIWRDDP